MSDAIVVRAKPVFEDPPWVVDGLDPWEQQKDETPKAYAGFNYYVGMPPHQRNVRAAYRLYSGNVDARYTPGWFHDWSKDWRWEERARLFDSKKKADEAQTQLERDQRLAQTRVSAATQLLVLGLDIIKRAAIGGTREVSPEGEVVEIPAITALEARALLRTGIISTDTGIKNLRSETDGDGADVRVNVLNAGNGPVQIFIPDNNRGDRR